VYDLSGERGLGRAIALCLAEEGADVSDSLQVDDMVRQALEWFGQIDILVNNAGALAGLSVSVAGGSHMD